MMFPICENDMQHVFLLMIKEVGWAIIQKKCSKSVFVQGFMSFYLDIEESQRENFLTEIIHIYDKVVKNECTPDDLLLSLGYYTQYIQEYDFYDEDNCPALGPYASDYIITLFDAHLSGDLSFIDVFNDINEHKILFR